MAKQILLTIAVLASRNKAEVKRCLDSLRPILEQIPSELVIVDTSQDAEVHALCLTYTDRVKEFVWCDDFSKARNVSVEMAQGEWYLFIDDDEWFVEYQELIDFFRSGKYKGYGCANYIQRNFHDAKGTFCSDNWVSRLIKLYPETRFYSRIHEYIAPQIGQCINLHVVANHTGYIAQTKEAKLKKFERNYPLLLEMMKEEPKRLRWRVQIVQELFFVQKWEEMCRFCEESIRKTIDCTSTNDCMDIGTFYAGLIEGLLALGRFDAAVGMEQAVKADRRLSRLTRAYLAQLFARAHFRRGEAAETRKWLAVYYEGMEYFEKHSKELERQQGTLLVDTAFDDVSKKRVVSLEIGCALLEDDTSVLAEHYDELGWGEPVMYLSDDLFPVLVDAMARMPEAEALLVAMRDLWNNRDTATKLFAAIDQKKGRDEEGYSALLRMTERTIPFDHWKELLSDFIARVSLDGLRTTEQGILKAKSEWSLNFDYALVRLAEARVLHSVRQKDYSAKRESFTDYANRASAFARRCFREETIRDYPELLPEYLAAGLLLGEALELEETDVPKAAGLMGQAAAVHPEIAGAVRSYLQAASTEQLNRELAAKEELRKLESSVKEQVCICLENKQYEAALEILAQLEEMKPNDLETAELVLYARLGLLKKSAN